MPVVMHCNSIPVIFLTMCTYYVNDHDVLPIVILCVKHYIALVRVSQSFLTLKGIGPYLKPFFYNTNYTDIFV